VPVRKRRGKTSVRLKTINLGLSASALAMPIRCLSPPLNSWGYLSRQSDRRPTLSRNSRTILSVSLSLLPVSSNGSAMISLILFVGSRYVIGAYNTICMFLLACVMFFSSIVSPSKTRTPSACPFSHNIDFPSVVLPHPDSPTRPRFLPFLSGDLRYRQRERSL
jgi:hypothetical protein